MQNVPGFLQIPTEHIWMLYSPSGLQVCWESPGTSSYGICTARLSGLGPVLRQLKKFALLLLCSVLRRFQLSRPCQPFQNSWALLKEEVAVGNERFC